MRKLLCAVVLASTVATVAPEVSANPVSPGGITEFSVDPDWIEVDCHYWPLGSKKPFIVDGKEVSIVWEKVLENYGERVVFDSTNTSGFDLKPEGGYIYFPAIYDTLFYGPGQMYPSPLSEESIAFFGEWQYGDYREPWTFDPTPTPHALNDAVARFGSGSVFINEIFHNEKGDLSFVELYNRADTDVDIGGYSLISGARYRIPTGIMIPARGYYVLSEWDFPKGFSISPEGGAIYLQNEKNEPVDQMGWPGGLESGISLNRIPDGFATEYQGYNYATSLDFREGAASPGAPNSGHPILSVQMEKTAKALCPGARRQYYCKGTDTRGRSARILPEWSITGDFATVAVDGTVTGIRCGEGVLTARYGAFTDTLYVRGVVGGVLENDAVWKKEFNPYRMEKHFWIKQGATLTIEPGVKVELAGSAIFQIGGTLRAIGDEYDPIHFTAANKDSLWYAMSIQGTGSRLDHCIIEGAENPLQITEYADSTTVSHCIVRGEASGIAVFGEAVLMNNFVVGSSRQSEKGIYITRMVRENTWELPGTARIINNTFIGWSKGIQITTAPVTVIRNNIISNCNIGIDGSADIAYNCLNVSTPFLNAPDGAGILSTTNARGTACDRFRNIFLDPEFSDALRGDYRLAANSPGIDAGDPTILDPDRTISDLGMYGGEGDVISGVQDSPSSARPHALRIERNYPNPFNPSTTIVFAIPEEGTARLTVYNITGGKVRELVYGRLPAGRHEARWDGRDDRGNELSSGVYLTRLSLGGKVTTAKMLMIK